MVSDRATLMTTQAQLRPWPRPQRGDQAGVTLVELMVALAISLFMVAALVVLYVNNSAARTELDRASRQIENGRFAIDMLRDDLALAGYYGEMSPADVTSFTEPNPCAADPTLMGWSTVAGPTPVRMPAAVLGPTDAADTVVPAAWGCDTPSALNQRAGTSYLVVRRVQPEGVAPSATLAATPYVQSNGCLDGVQPFVLGTGADATNFPLVGPDCLTARPARVYLTRLYYVSTCGVCSPSDGIPTLKMRELRGNALVERTVSDGIEDLQFEFGRDTDGDGIVDDFVAAVPAGEWSSVIAVRVYLISRATAATPGYSDDKIYARGPFGDYTPASSETQFKRRAYSAVAHLPNVAGPRETP